MFVRFVAVNECTTLMQTDQILWSRTSSQQRLPARLPFQVVIPEMGFDSSIELPPSFSAKWRCRENKAKLIAFKTDLEVNGHFFVLKNVNQLAISRV